VSKFFFFITLTLFSTTVSASNLVQTLNEYSQRPTVTESKKFILVVGAGYEQEAYNEERYPTKKDSPYLLLNSEADEKPDVCCDITKILFPNTYKGKFDEIIFEQLPAFIINRNLILEMATLLKDEGSIISNLLFNVLEENTSGKEHYQPVSNMNYFYDSTPAFQYQLVRHNQFALGRNVINFPVLSNNDKFALSEHFLTINNLHSRVLATIEDANANLTWPKKLIGKNPNPPYFLVIKKEPPKEGLIHLQQEGNQPNNGGGCKC
jgi:hypothetical protein